MEMENQLKLNSLVSNDDQHGDGAQAKHSTSSPPLTPVARFRFTAAQTGTGRRDSGYGTDNVPSPASAASARHFSFSDSPLIDSAEHQTDNGISDILRGFDNVGIHTDSESESHSEDVFFNTDVEFSIGADADMDDTDLEVEDIANNNCCGAGIHSVSDSLSITRPHAPPPFDDSSEMDILVGSDPGATGILHDYAEKHNAQSASFAYVFEPRKLSQKDEKHSGTPILPRALCMRENSGHDEPTSPQPRDRSVSLPDVLELTRRSSGREIGFKLRRLSDDFYYFYYYRQLGRTFSLQSQNVPLRVSIDVFTSETPSTHRRTDPAVENSPEHTDLSNHE